MRNPPQSNKVCLRLRSICEWHHRTFEAFSPWNIKVSRFTSYSDRDRTHPYVRSSKITRNLKTNLNRVITTYQSDRVELLGTENSVFFWPYFGVTVSSFQYSSVFVVFDERSACCLWKQLPSQIPSQSLLAGKGIWPGYQVPKWRIVAGIPIKKTLMI